MKTLYDFTVKTPSWGAASLWEYRWKVILIVNTATKCGLSWQFHGLEQLYKKYGPEKFIILWFPCWQFANQEPWASEEVAAVCQRNFGVSFPIFAKVDVNWEAADPVFQFLKDQKGGIFGDTIKWNFTKFLIDSHGNVVKRYSPFTAPERIAEDIETYII